ncbi:hypothetical protein PRIPAC_89802 [Pristionchus pacificus]|uniref:Uncharacterized protein n=1 Tax=Pristionchus pacificus TaxID=54126 RepID=A0A2A6B8N0_PRIPA|nr:hypothetical protein PRIPAC_89802 [Pristionchus pacificus]|eukprot:PDM62217.1 hypothetical protein PRIPAC_51659 [Pristionchus pacificus]
MTAPTMNFNFYDFDNVVQSFSLPLGPLLFDEMRVRVLEIIQKTEQKFFWDDGFSRVSLNNHNDLEAAVNWSFQSSKISGNEPEVQIWFESERIPDVSSMPVYKIIPMDEEQAAAYAHVVEAATADFYKMHDVAEYFKAATANVANHPDVEKYREINGVMREAPMPAAYETFGDYLNAAAAFYSEMIYSQQ